MNKRGQVFLIAAIIFVLALYSIIIPYNTLKTYPGLEDYKDLSENYQAEYPKVINFALYKNLNIKDTADDFTKLFLQEANKKDPKFGVFYIYKDNSGNLHIVNTLNNKALKLEYTDPTTAEDVELTLLSGRDSVSGNLCINGIGCNRQESFVGNFDQAYYQADITAPNRLGINILGVAGLRVLDIADFTSMIYIESEEPTPLEGAPDQVGVSLIQY